MASKKAGRLAGLAALAGLAYMANKKGEGKTPDAGNSETKETPAPARDDSKKVIESRVRKDDDITVAGEGGFDTPADMSSSPRVGTPARTASSVKAPSASAASQTGRFAPSGSPVAKAAAGIGNAKPVVAQGGDRSARADMSKPAQTGNAKSVVAPGGDRSVRSDNARPVFAPGGNRSVRNFDYENDETKEMNRGGKVKKMASGGMTASRRGDGIAQRGKTRGKMY
jgi:hypothetical protein